MIIEVFHQKNNNLYYVRLMGKNTVLMISKPYKKRESSLRLARVLQKNFSKKIPIFYKRYKSVVREI